MCQDFRVLDDRCCEIKNKPAEMLAQQNRLAAHGAVELVLTAISWAADDRRGDELVVAACLLGCALLLGGNRQVQAKFYAWMLQKRLA